MRTALSLIFLLALASCSVVKNVNRNKEKTHIETDSTASSQVKTEEVETEQVTTITTIQVDTSVVVPGSTVTGEALIADLITTPLILENGDQVISVSVNADGKLKATGVIKDRTANLHYKKRTEQKVNTQRKTVAEVKTEVSQKKIEQRESKSSERNVKRNGFNFVWVIIVVAVIVMIYLTLRKRLPFLP